MNDNYFEPPKSALAQNQLSLSLTQKIFIGLCFFYLTPITILQIIGVGIVYSNIPANLEIRVGMVDFYIVLLPMLVKIVSGIFLLLKKKIALVAISVSLVLTLIAAFHRPDQAHSAFEPNQIVFRGNIIDIAILLLSCALAYFLYAKKMLK